MHRLTGLHQCTRTVTTVAALERAQQCPHGHLTSQANKFSSAGLWALHCASFR
eukprot:jgi/Bigna1/62810/fgenesh1_kg.42_\